MNALKSMLTLTLKAATLTVALSGVAQAQTNQRDNLKLVVLQGSEAAQLIQSGHYQQGIARLNADRQDTTDNQYEAAMSRCVANVHLNHFEVAYRACNKAVNLVGQTSANRRDKKNYKALALNNRAIARYLQDDSKGAYRDFLNAVALSKNVLIAANFNQFSMRLLDEQFADDKTVVNAE